MTPAPPSDDSELPCVTCRVSMAEHGTAYCDDCAEDERLEALILTFPSIPEWQGLPGSAPGQPESKGGLAAAAGTMEKAS